MDIEGAVQQYNQERLARRADYEVSDEERKAYADELARVGEVFNGVVEGRSFYVSHNKYMRHYTAIDMGEHEVDGRTTKVVIRPNVRRGDSIVAYGLDILIPEQWRNDDSDGYIPLTTMVVRADASCTQGHIEELREFGQLLDEVAAAAEAEAQVPASV